MIKWTGKSGNGIWRRKETARTMSELHDACVENGTISLIDYDPFEKYILEREGYSYEEVADKLIEEGSYIDEFYSDNNINVEMTDYDFYKLISNETGNALYQTFTDEDDNELEFGENGMIK